MKQKAIKNKNARVKITFESINEGNYTIIPKKDIEAANQRVKKSMRESMKKYRSKMDLKYKSIIRCD